MKILLTGATGMLGKYLTDVFKGEEITTLGRRQGNDIVCDLTEEAPRLARGYSPELIIHAAGTEEPGHAFELNFEGTRRLLEGLGDCKPEHFVYISSWQVYSLSAGADIEEDANLWASGDAGKSKAKAEEMVSEWCDRHSVNLTILRPATMFGSGMKGWANRMFNEVMANRFVHIRGSEGRLSAVMALDVAKAVKQLYTRGGVYNVADGQNPTYLQLAEAMSANSGVMKRVVTLPEKWAAVFYKYGKSLPLIRAALNPELLKKRQNVLTFSNAKALDAGCTFFAVCEVLRHEAEDYPYQDS